MTRRKAAVAALLAACAVVAVAAWRSVSPSSPVAPAQEPVASGETIAAAMPKPTRGTLADSGAAAQPSQSMHSAPHSADGPSGPASPVSASRLTAASGARTSNVPVTAAAAPEPSVPSTRQLTRTRVVAAPYGVAVAALDAPADAAPAGGVRLCLRVVDDARVPVPGAKIRLRDGDALSVVETDAEGRGGAVFAPGRTVEVLIESVPRGYARGARDPERATLEQPSFALVLDAGEPLVECTLEVARLGNAQVRIPGLPRDARWIAYPMWRDALGAEWRAPHGNLAHVGDALRVEDLPLGEIDLHVHVADVGSGVAQLRIVPGSDHVATLHLLAGGATVAASLAAPPTVDEVRMSLTELVSSGGRSSQWELRVRRTGSDGKLLGRVSGLRPGTYLLGAVSPDGGALFGCVLDVPVGETVFALPPLPPGRAAPGAADEGPQVLLAESASLRGRFCGPSRTLLFDEGADERDWARVRKAGDRFALHAGRYTAVTWTGADRIAPWGANWVRTAIDVHAVSAELRLDVP